MGLGTRDLEGVLAFVADAHDVDGPEPLTTELLDRLTELVGCEYATYQESDLSCRIVTAYVPCSNEGPEEIPPPYVLDPAWCPPVLRWNGRAFDKLSDRLGRRHRERLRDEEESNHEFRIVDRLGFRVGDRRTRHASLRLESQGRDFDERDRELALMLQPHVDVIWRRAGSRRRTAELLEAVEADRKAIVLHGPDGRIDHATTAAQRLLAGWFGTRNGHLPRELAEWRAHAGPGDRYVERRNGSVLTVETSGDSTLILGEQLGEAVPLTGREREVLALVAEGLTNAQIGRSLWVAESTVAKHLEQAYRKLGVHTRTAAVARFTNPSN